MALFNEEDKVTKQHCPALLIEEKVVCFVFHKEDVVKYPYGGKDDTRQMIVVKKETYEEWIKDNYKDLS